MTDVFPQDKRSWIMGRVKGENTSAEMKVRSLTHRLGFRFRLHRKDLPGKPDLVFPSKRKVIFVHGCFWHGHTCARGERVPKANREYWVEKIKKNVERDQKNFDLLVSLGWKILVLWECECKVQVELAQVITYFIGRSDSYSNTGISKRQQSTQ